MVSLASYTVTLDRMSNTLDQYSLQYEITRPRQGLGPLIHPSLGPIRSNTDPASKIGPRARRLPSCILQKHPRDGSGDQWMEASAGGDLSRERHGTQGGRADEEICREHRSDRAR